MLNEVRRKPEKPRISFDGYSWACQKTGSVTGNGATPILAYVAWNWINLSINPPTRA